MNVCKTEQEYLDQIIVPAQKACKRYGYLPSILIAQACVENGFGIVAYFDNPEITKLLSANNVVGVKRELLNKSWVPEYSCWDGSYITKNTPEVYGGKQVTIKDDFRKYDSVEQCFCDFLCFLTYASNYGKGGTPKYGKEVLSIKDPETLIKEVNRRGYTTGTTYPTSVMKIVRKHNLTQYDDLTNVTPSNILPPALQKSADKKEENMGKTAKGKKVMLDAGHYGYYNQSPAIKDYWESKMTWKLHLMLKEELEKYGIIVGTTRPKQENDLALYDRGYKSKGYDLFLSLHSNAVDDNVHENIDYPVCFVQISGKSDKIGTLLSECVRRVMGTTQPADHWSKRGNNGDYYGVLRGATAAGTVGCIVEHSFHTQTRATRWLMDDNNLRKLAVEEAKVINEYLGGSSSSSVTPSTPTVPDTEKYHYKVRKVGTDEKTQIEADEILDNAKKTANKNRGYKVFDSNKNFECVYDPYRWHFLDAMQEVVDLGRKENWTYGNSQSTPPCADKICSCDRSIARALYNLGNTDQVTGGETCGTLGTYLPAHGWKKVTDKSKIEPGAVVEVRYTNHNYVDHVFVVVSYDPKTGLCTKYDTGSTQQIRSQQPFKDVPLLSWGANRIFVAAYNPPETATSPSEPDQKEDKSGIVYPTTFNGIDYKAVYTYSTYKKKYADLQKAFGNDKNAYFKHFCEFGMKEGRVAKATFNVQKYKQRYPDLQKAFGDNLPLYYKHYIQYGKREGRKAT